jgi:4-amino-4-deoxy-L-arabinose transferase-like glycosyltransferase
MRFLQIQFNKSNVIGIIVFIALVYFPLFLHLDSLPIRIWDESRLAVNAYEMDKDSDFLVTHYLGRPDMWNTKPPLVIWLQVFFIKLFGIGELAIRLPSAFAGFLTCIAILFFSIKYLKNYWFGTIAILILITSFGYINLHVTRTGDYDAVLTLFTTGFCFSYFLFIQNNSIKYLHLFFIFVTLAVLTKSVQGLLFMPALLIYTLLVRKFMFLIRARWLWIDLALCIIVIAGYYLLREFHNPGYLKAVWENDLWGRYVRQSDPTKGDFWFYCRNFVEHQYPLWIWLIPTGILLGFVLQDERIRKLLLFCSLIGIIYLLITSLSDGKLEWYIAPMYPLLAIIGAVPIYWVFTTMKNSSHVNQQFKVNTMPYVFLLFVYLIPYIKTIDRVYKPREYPWEEEYYFISRYLQDSIKGVHRIYKRDLCYDGYSAQLLYYVKILNDMGQEVEIVNWRSLKIGSLVLISQDEIKKCIEKRYLFEPMDSFYSIHTYKITGRRAGYELSDAEPN